MNWTKQLAKEVAAPLLSLFLTAKTGLPIIGSAGSSAVKIGADLLLSDEENTNLQKFHALALQRIEAMFEELNSRSQIAQEPAEQIKDRLLTSLQTPLEAEDFVRAQFNYALLAKQLQNRAKRPQSTWGAAELTAYDRSFTLAARIVMILYQKIPDFQLDEFRTFLNSQSLRITLLEDAFRGLRESMANSDAGKATNDDFTEEYKNVVFDRLNRMAIQGVPRFTSLNAEVALERTYATLFLLPHAEAIAEVNRSEQAARLDIEEALSLSRRIVILGEAGSGKSTLVNWIAVSSITSRFRGKLKHLNGRVPIVIRLRNYNKHEFPELNRLHLEISRSFVKECHVGWLHDLAANDRALLLVDGFDELSDERRRDCLAWLDDILSRLPKVPVILSSRPAALSAISGTGKASSSALSARNYSFFTIAPLSVTHRNELIDRWFSIIAASSRPDMADHYETLGSALKEGIGASRALQDLAATPLLCSMLCTVTAADNTFKSVGKWELVEEFIDVMMYVRQRDKGIPAWIECLAVINISEKEGLLWLARLAWELMTQDLSDCDSDYVNQFFVERLSEKGVQQAEYYADQYTLALLERSGLFFSPQSAKMAFYHRIFQEYLSARYCNARFAKAETILKRSVDPAWQGTVLAYSGMCNEEAFEWLMLGMIEAAKKDEQNCYLYFLSARCCAERIPSIMSVNSAVKRSVDEFLVASREWVIPHLVTSGDLAVELLLVPDERNTSRNRFSAKTLRAIGSERAAHALLNYMCLEDAVVNHEILLLNSSKGFPKGSDVVQRIGGDLVVDDELFMKPYKYREADGIVDAFWEEVRYQFPEVRRLIFEGAKGEWSFEWDRAMRWIRGCKATAIVLHGVVIDQTDTDIDLRRVSRVELCDVEVCDVEAFLEAFCGVTQLACDVETFRGIVEALDSLPADWRPPADARAKVGRLGVQKFYIGGREYVEGLDYELNCDLENVLGRFFPKVRKVMVSAGIKRLSFARSTNKMFGDLFERGILPGCYYL